jgi:hypothetical protein
MNNTTDNKDTKVSYPNILIYRHTRFQFDPHKIIYSNPKPSGHGGYVIKAQYPVDGNLMDGTPVKQNVDILLQTPEMTTTFGMSTKEHDAGKIRGTVGVTFFDDANADVQSFKAVMSMWDQLLLEEAKRCKQVWFKSNKVTDEILTYLYNPMVRRNIRKKDNKEFSASFRSKIPRRFDRFDCECYNDLEQPIPLNEITRMCTLRKLCRHTGIWFSDTMFVSSFESIQIQKLSEGRISGYAFVQSGCEKHIDSDPHSIVK